MRIIIEIDEESETTEAEIREESRSTETTREEATDAGGAPSSGHARPEETMTPGPSPRQTLGSSEQATDAGAAPQSMTDPTTEGRMDVSSGDNATDGGAAPGANPELGRSPSLEGEMAPSGGVPTRTPETMLEEGTDAGPPPEPVEESSAVVEGAAMDYEAIVSGTVEEVKDRVEGGNLDLKKVLDAERSGDARSTLIEWLEGRKA